MMKKKKIGISEEDAKKYVDDFVQKIGMDWEIYDVGCAAGFKYKEDLDYTDKYDRGCRIDYGRQLYSICV